MIQLLGIDKVDADFCNESDSDLVFTAYEALVEIEGTSMPCIFIVRYSKRWDTRAVNASKETSLALDAYKKVPPPKLPEVGIVNPVIKQLGQLVLRHDCGEALVFPIVVPPALNVIKLLGVDKVDDAGRVHELDGDHATSYEALIAIGETRRSCVYTVSRHKLGEAEIVTVSPVKETYLSLSAYEPEDPLPGHPAGVLINPVVDKIGRHILRHDSGEKLLFPIAVYP